VGVAIRATTMMDVISRSVFIVAPLRRRLSSTVAFSGRLDSKHDRVLEVKRDARLRDSSERQQNEISADVIAR